MRYPLLERLTSDNGTLSEVRNKGAPNMQQIVVREHAGQLAHLQEVVERAKEYARQAKAENTLRAYRSDWAHFEEWCSRQGLAPLPAAPATVALYITALAEAGRTVSTIRRRLASISAVHQAAGHQSPTQDMQVKTIWAGIRRAKGTAQRQVAPVVTEHLRAIVGALQLDTLAGLRDRALLLVGFIGAFRRSELVGLNVEDLTPTAEGFVVTLRRSKTDQEGEGETKAIPYGANAETCPARALRAWLDAAGITSGPVFRAVNRHGQVSARRLSDRAVALIVKRSVEAVGLDASRFSGHSLRAGFATAAARAGASERDIARVTHHKSDRVLRRYIRDAQVFDNAALSAVGL